MSYYPYYPYGYYPYGYGYNPYGYYPYPFAQEQDTVVTPPGTKPPTMPVSPPFPRLIFFEHPHDIVIAAS